MQVNTPKRSAGFTLVEIAIVLVIIGLLLGGVLKGQEMIENGKVKSAVNDMNGVIAAYNGYRDRYHRLPGDDGPTATLTARGANWAAQVGGDNDGILDITAANTFDGGGEADNFWGHLRAAGLVTGNPADAAAAAVPRNAFNGLMDVTVNVLGNSGASICLSQVPGKAAVALDNQLDDGLPNTGSVRAIVGTAGANTDPTVAAPAITAYSEDNQYTLCRTL